MDMMGGERPRRGGSDCRVQDSGGRVQKNRKKQKAVNRLEGRGLYP
jgi:hypothetical protein